MNPFASGLHDVWLTVRNIFTAGACIVLVLVSLGIFLRELCGAAVFERRSHDARKSRAA